MGTEYKPGYKEYNIPPTLKIPAWAIDYTADDLSQAIQAARDALVHANINRNLDSAKSNAISSNNAGYYARSVVEARTEAGDVYYTNEYTEAGTPVSQGENVNNYAKPDLENTILALTLNPYATIADADERSNTFYIKVPDPQHPDNDTYAKYYPYGVNDFSFLKLNENFIDINSKLYATIRKARKYLEEISPTDSGKFLLIRSAQEGEDASVELVYDKATLDMFKLISDASQNLIGVKTDGSIAPMKLSVEHIDNAGLSNMQIISGKQHELIVSNITSILATLETDLKRPQDIEANYNTASTEWQAYVAAYKQLVAYAEAINLVTYADADAACAAFTAAQSALTDIEIKAQVLKALDAFAAMLYATPNSGVYADDYDDLGFAYYMADGSTQLDDETRTNCNNHFTALKNFYNLWSYDEENKIRYTSLKPTPSTSAYQYAFNDDATAYENDVDELCSSLALPLILTDNISQILTALSLEEETFETLQDLINVIYDLIAEYEASTGALGKLRITHLSQRPSES